MNELYEKIVGMVPGRTYNERHTEHVRTHVRTHGKICTIKLFKSDDVTKIESRFKASQFYKKNKTKDIPNDKGGSYDEIFKLSPTLTSDMIIHKIIEIGGEELEDLPPSYSSVVSKKNTPLEIEREKTKQDEIKLKQKEEDTKQKNIDLESKRLDFEIMKYNKQLQIESSSSYGYVDSVKLSTSEYREESNLVEAWCKENLEYEKDGILEYKDLHFSFFW